MNKNTKRMMVIAVINIMTVSLFVLSGCAGGNSVSGKWYPICANPATAAGSLEFNSGGSFETDGITGTWEASDGIVQFDIWGFHNVYEVGEYEGYKVLYKQGGQRPQYCHSVEDAEAVYALLYQQ